MGHLSLEAKAAVVNRAMNQNSQGIKEIASTNNIGYSTLQRWLKDYRTNSCKSTPEKGNKKDPLSRSEKFDHIFAAAGLDETGLGIYCRKQGIYSHQLQAWKQEIMKDSSQINHKLHNEVKRLKAENKRLQKDLNRKDKALAETSALLILKKKADLILGGS